MMDALRSVVPKLEHAQALAVDDVARTTHICTIQRELGILVVAPVAAKVKANSKTARIENEAYLRAATDATALRDLLTSTSSPSAAGCAVESSSSTGPASTCR